MCVCTCVSDSRVMRLGCCNQCPFSQAPSCVAVLCVWGGGVQMMFGASLNESHMYE